MNDREVLTVAEAAQWLQISKNTVYELIRRGKLPHFRVGRGIRIFKDELIAFLRRLQAGQSGE